MGRSLRRYKSRLPKIIKRKPKTPFTKSKAPLEIKAQRPDLKRKLGAEATWDERQKIDRNYEQSGLVFDASARFGRNSIRPDAIQEKAEQQEELGANDPQEAEGADLDDDLKAAMGQVRSTGPAPPKRLTPHQRRIVQRLLAAHGEDVGSMVMDRRLNPMQHSRGALEKLIAAFRHWRDGSGVDFRAPTKTLW